MPGNHSCDADFRGPFPLPPTLSPSGRSLPANVVRESLQVIGRTRYSFFVRTDFTWRVKAGYQLETWQRRSVAGLHACRDSFYRTARARKQDRPGVTEIPLELLPRLCPLCGERTIIGHGQRSKHAHDQRHQQIRIRRGRFRPCHKTFTVLPDWSPPSGQCSLLCQQQAWELLHQADGTWERSVPDVADASRSPDPSMVGRWSIGGISRFTRLNECRSRRPTRIAHFFVTMKEGEKVDKQRLVVPARLLTF